MRGYRSWHPDKFRKPDRRTRTLGRAECVMETERAILVKHGMRLALQTWIPQSAVHEKSEVWQFGQTGKLVVYAWWAEARGM